MSDWDRIERSPALRRAFLKRMTAAGLGFAAAGLFNDTHAGAATPAPAKDDKAAAAAPAAVGPIHQEPPDAAQQFASIPGKSIDIQVLNFALTLEILEADLYRQALNVASGRPIQTPLSGNPGSYQLKVGGGGLGPYGSQDLFGYLVSFTYVEAAHRDFVRAAVQSLGGTPVGPHPGGYRFPIAVAGNINDIMSNILALEETGVRAYLGALPYLQDLNLATMAATIFSTEARHAGVISQQLGRDTGPNRMGGDLTVVPNPPAPNVFEYYRKPKEILATASKFFA